MTDGSDEVARHDPARDELERELVRTRDALRTAESKFDSIVFGSPQGIVIQQDGRIVYANPAMAELFGYAEPARMVGLDPFADLIAEPDLELFRRRTESVYQGALLEPVPYWRAKRPDGQLRWLSSTAHRSAWNGRPAVTSFYKDVTAHRVAELATEESRALYRAALTAGRMGAWEIDLSTGVRHWTAEGLALLGLDLPDGRGRVGGADDEFRNAVLEEDRHIVRELIERLADEQNTETEFRIVRPDGKIVWLAGRGEVVGRYPDGSPRRVVNIMADVTERKAKELHIQFLIRELTHRSRNLLAVVQSLAKQSARSTTTVAEYQEGLTRRLQGLAASQDVLMQGAGTGGVLQELVRAHLAPFVERSSDRVLIDGPDVAIPLDATQAIGLAIHELATNALKHGALSNQDGKIAVSWSCEEIADRRRDVRFIWQETGGPEVSLPTRRGFGHVVLHDVVPRSLDGTVDIDYAPGGLRWSLQFSLDPA